ncbi:hypothetical protein [Brachybacterium sacelli]|uniref:hypothetical protein n=1 Tax=Brachybacterium sacelli TaxID=173364 RepID=UPI0033846151
MPRQSEFPGRAFRHSRCPVLLGTRKNITQVGGERQAGTGCSEGDRSDTELMTAFSASCASDASGHHRRSAGLRAGVFSRRLVAREQRSGGEVRCRPPPGSLREHDTDLEYDEGPRRYSEGAFVDQGNP